MTTIQVKKSDLIAEIAVSHGYFGDDFAAIYVTNNGEIRFYDNYTPSDQFKIFDFSGLCEFIDEEGNYPGSDEYDSRGVAEYIVKEDIGLVLSHPEYDYKTSENDVEIELV